MVSQKALDLLYCKLETPNKKYNDENTFSHAKGFATPTFNKRRVCYVLETSEEQTHKGFGINIYKGYTYDMRVYLGKDRAHTTDTMTATHATVAGLTRIQNMGHKLYMDNFFSSPDLFDNLHSKNINRCGAVRLK
jgi:hypothetical protein